MKENDRIHNLFQEQRKIDGTSVPSFEKVFAKANRKQHNMKRGRFFAITLLLFFLGAAAWWINKNQEVIETDPTILRASMNFYQSLMNKGEFVTNDIHFDFDDAAITENSMPILHSIVKSLKEHPEIRIRIEGHTSGYGSASYNQKLSTHRALAVKEALINLSIDEKRLETVGLGESKPVAPNDSELGRAKNRRVAFVKL